LLIVLMTIGPMVLATLMYKLQFWVPETRSYHGELIGDGRTLADIGVQAAAPRWQLLVTEPAECARDCRQLVYLARQIQIGLGRDAGRASHGLASAQPQAGEYEQLLAQEYPQLKRYGLDAGRYRQALGAHPGVQLWLVDPHGNLVLRYASGVNGKDVLTDLRQLLKLSNIG
jgi:hypothetical protein